MIGGEVRQAVMASDNSLARGIRYYNSKRYEQALRELLAVDEAISENVTLAYYTGLVLTKLERYEEALIYLEQVVSTSDSLMHVYQSRMILAYVYATTKRMQLAEYELKQLIDSGMESVQLYGSLGSVLYAMGRVPDAVDSLKRALEINPEYGGALNSLGFIYAQEGLDPAQAVQLCGRAVRLQPRNAAYLDSLAWALYKAGSTSEARESVRKALDLAPGNAEIAAHMRVIMEAQP